MPGVRRKEGKNRQNTRFSENKNALSDARMVDTFPRPFSNGAQGKEGNSSLPK